MGAVTELFTVTQTGKAYLDGVAVNFTVKNRGPGPIDQVPFLRYFNSSLIRFRVVSTAA